MLVSAANNEPGIKRPGPCPSLLCNPSRTCAGGVAIQEARGAGAHAGCHCRHVGLKRLPLRAAVSRAIAANRV